MLSLSQIKQHLLQLHNESDNQTDRKSMLYIGFQTEKYTYLISTYLSEDIFGKMRTGGPVFTFIDPI